MIEDSAAPSPNFLRTVVGALTLREETYAAAGRDEHPFRNGLIFVALIGVAVGLASLVGALLTWWVSPDMMALKDTIFEGLKTMPWRDQIPPEALDNIDAQISAIFDQVWSTIAVINPGPAQAAIGVLYTPIGMILGWLLYGLLIHLFARMLSGKATLAQTYGGVALASAPTLLGVVQVLPFVQTAGLGIWAVCCTFVAVKTVHGLSSGRAFWVVLLPYLLFLVLALLLGASILALVLLLQPAGIGGLT